MKIINVIDAVDDGKHIPRRLDEIELIVVHRVGKDLRTGIDLGDTAEDICAHFNGRDTTHPEIAAVTGGHLPYSLMIGGDLGETKHDGVIWQCLSIDDVGHHARRWSHPGIGIALIGDARERQPSDAQRIALIDLCAELCIAFAMNPKDCVRGHDELRGGSGDPNKRCPGDLLDMNQARDDVLAIIAERGRRNLTRHGLTFC